MLGWRYAIFPRWRSEKRALFAGDLVFDAFVVDVDSDHGCLFLHIADITHGDLLRASDAHRGAQPKGRWGGESGLHWHALMETG